MARRSRVNWSSPIVHARNSGNVCPDSNMIAAYCPQLPCHGLAIVATKSSFPEGYRLLSKRGRWRLPLTFWPNRLILMWCSLMEAAKTPYVQLAQLKHLPPHQVCWRSCEAQRLSILVQRLFPHSNITMKTSLSRTAIKIFISMLSAPAISVNFRLGFNQGILQPMSDILIDEKSLWLVSPHS